MAAQESGAAEAAAGGEPRTAGGSTEAAAAAAEGRGRELRSPARQRLLPRGGARRGRWARARGAAGSSDPARAWRLPPRAPRPPALSGRT